MADSTIFRGTPTDRYGVGKPASAAEAFGLQVPRPDHAASEERDAMISRDIRKGDSTLAGWMNGLDQKLEAAKLFISNGNVPAAMAIDDEIKKVANANPDLILEFSNMRNVQPGSLAERMRGIATRLRDGSYLGDKVTFGGQEYTYGALLRSDAGRFAVEQSTGDTLSTLGFSRDVAKFLTRGTADAMSDELKANPDSAQSVLANSDSTAAACMKMLTDSDLKATALRKGVVMPDPTRAIRSGMANELAANWKDYFMAFGSATEDFTSRALASFGDSGGHRMMPAMRAYALHLHGKTGLTGKALVDETFRQYDDWRTSVTRTERRLRPGERPDPDDVGLNEQNAALAGAISALSRMDMDFDLTNPASRANASELGDMVAKMKVSGVNLVGLARRNGTDVNTDMAMHILGVANPGSSIENVRAFFEDSKRYTGGDDFASAVYGTTHSAADYWSSLDRRNGGSSTCPGADALLVGVQKARAQSILPVMFKRGVSHRDAMSLIRRDYNLASDYAGRMADAFTRALPGAGAAEAASALTRYMLEHEADAQGGGVGMQKMITDMAEGKVDGVKLSAAAKDSLRGWVDANVRDAALFGDLASQMQQKLHGFGVDPYLAAMLTSQASARASRLKSLGKDWRAPFDTFLSDLTLVPEQQFDGNGRHIRTSMVFGHANKLDKELHLRGQKVQIKPGMYDANPELMESLFRQIGIEGKELDAQRMTALRALARENPQDYVQDAP